MPEIKIYTPNDVLPIEIEHQIRAYVRILWYDAYTEGVYDAPLVPSERHPHFVILGKKRAVFSAARISWVHLEHKNVHYKVYCLGDVFTYPAFRGKGYGHQVVEAGTNMIRADPEADIAILFTSPELVQFYERSGWEAMPTLSATIGPKANPEPYTPLAMMMFISEKARSTRSNFESKTVHLPGYGW